ncbi:arylamine N-acetyltransferase, pineal gland isozyme NAT-3-like [Pelobates fuscus]|uniref:arylamine N-acetyltransferase, pineal gland isozyme NAT-3-like n=1 Tax=Pelobates fuscus TaxID=191477 RepID=UPI002FE4E26F
MDVKAYLHRIGITATPAPSLVALRKLHRQHLLSIPVENLSFHSDENIALDQDFLYEKIVVKRRGGCCFENNGLLLWLLQVLGYKVFVLSARVRDRTTGFFGPPTHMVLTVELEGRWWLCDVGFGEGIREPLPLVAGWEEEQECGKFRLRENQEEWVLEENKDGTWTGLYKFTLEERCLEDFKWSSEYHQSSRSSIIFCKTFCTLQLPRGRLTYVGHKLISTEFIAERGKVKTTQHLKDDEILNVLRDRFGIVLSRMFFPKDEKMLPLAYA